MGLNYLEGLDLITQRLKLKDFDAARAAAVAEQYNMKAEDVEFVRKGLVPTDLQFEDGERAVVSYITTSAKDRDREIVDPAGAILDDYKKNPVVLFCHDYRQLPIGKNLWIKADNKGLVAKTAYASHEEAEKVYQYRKAGFPLAESIGFVPLEYEEYNEAERDKNGGVRRKFTKWLLLEYSDVPVPSNPEAIQIAVSKGIVPINVQNVIEEEQSEKNVLWKCPYCSNIIGEKEIYFDGTYWYHSPCKEKGAIVLPDDKDTIKDVSKPGWDETDSSFRYRVRNPGLFADDSFRTVPIKRDKPRVNSVMGKLTSKPDVMTLQSLIFPKEDEWTMESAKSWLGEHQGLLKAITDEADVLLLGFIATEDALVEMANTKTVTTSAAYTEVIAGEKSGRVLSAKNRSVIAKAISETKQAVIALEALLAANDAAEESDEGNTDAEDEGKSIVTDVLSEALKGIKEAASESINICANDYEGFLANVEKESGVEEMPDIVSLVEKAINKAKGKVI